MLLYLAQHHDKDHVLWFDRENDPDNYSEMLQWMCFAVSRLQSALAQVLICRVVDSAWRCGPHARPR